MLLQPAWLLVDFDNWRDWEHEEEDGMAEYEHYIDVSPWHLFIINDP